MWLPQVERVKGLKEVFGRRQSIKTHTHTHTHTNVSKSKNAETTRNSPFLIKSSLPLDEKTNTTDYRPDEPDQEELPSRRVPQKLEKLPYFLLNIFGHILTPSPSVVMLSVTLNSTLSWE